MVEEFSSAVPYTPECEILSSGPECHLVSLQAPPLHLAVSRAKTQMLGERESSSVLQISWQQQVGAGLHHSAVYYYC